MPGEVEAAFNVIRGTHNQLHAHAMRCERLIAEIRKSAEGLVILLEYREEFAQLAHDLRARTFEKAQW